MASSKEIQQPSRPMLTGGGRHHSHSMSSGSLNANHRVTRRKSITNNAASNAAVVAAAAAEGVSIPISTRRNTVSRTGGHRSGSHYPSPPNSLSYRSSMGGRKNERNDNAIDDDDEDDSSFPKARMRRASEGQHLTKEGKKSELVCETCSKKYKHSSCLSKHLWEHTPEWAYTSKLLISKHQQVQLLEAASVLVTMNKDADTPPGSARDFHSDRDSASPSASVSSAHRDGQSSADTTPPPQSELQSGSYIGSAFGGSKRYSNGSSFAHSYQSAPLNNPLFAGSAPNGSSFGHYRHHSQDRRPPSSGISPGGQEDEAGLAAAVELLSCSFGTPKTNPTFGDDVPPVPPLPAQYLSQSAFSNHGLPEIRRPSQATESYTRRHVPVKDDGDVKMEESGGESVMDEDDYRRQQDDDDEGVFGRMEE